MFVFRMCTCLCCKLNMFTLRRQVTLSQRLSCCHPWLLTSQRRFSGCLTLSLSGSMRSGFHRASTETWAMLQARCEQRATSLTSYGDVVHCSHDQKL